MILTDKELVELTLIDKNAYSKLIKRYGRLVDIVLYRYCRNTHDRQDLAQDVFITVWQKLHTFDFQRSPHLAPWIATIAKYQGLHHIIKSKKHEISYHSWLTADDSSLDKFSCFAVRNKNTTYSNKNGGSTSKTFTQAFSQLSSVEKEVLRLRFILNHNTDKTAKCLGLHPALVQFKTLRAKKRLQQKL